MKRALGKSYSEIDEENQIAFDFLHPARSHDPETSHIAAEKITSSGKREASCLIILGVLKTKDGLTSKEISARCSLDRHTCGRRMTDLEQSKLVRRGNKVTCSVDGGQALAWYLLEKP